METALLDIYFQRILQHQRSFSNCFIHFLFQLFPVLKDIAMAYFYTTFYYFRGLVRVSCPIKDLIPPLHFNWVIFLYRSFVLITACFPSFYKDSLLGGPFLLLEQIHILLNFAFVSGLHLDFKFLFASKVLPESFWYVFFPLNHIHLELNGFFTL